MRSHGPAELDSMVWEAHMRLHSLIADLVDARAGYTRIDPDTLTIDDMGPLMPAADAVALCDEQLELALRALAAADTAMHATRAVTSRLHPR